uniref:Uncharacterized protein n=1 Tax=Caenorhabditis japonica TaxID=281687 RepID=A0A8R1DTN0_CAEJA
MRATVQELSNVNQHATRIAIERDIRCDLLELQIELAKKTIHPPGSPNEFVYDQKRPKPIGFYAGKLMNMSMVMEETQKQNLQIFKADNQYWHNEMPKNNNNYDELMIPEAYILEDGPFHPTIFLDGYRKLFLQCAPDATYEELATLDQLEKSVTESIAHAHCRLMTRCKQQLDRIVEHFKLEARKVIYKNMENVNEHVNENLVSHLKNENATLRKQVKEYETRVEGLERIVRELNEFQQRENLELAVCEEQGKEIQQFMINDVNLNINKSVLDVDELNEKRQNEKG